MRRTAAAAAATRREILDAALLVFAARGWSGATLDGIARRAGLTRGAVHHHFRDKDELLGAVLAEQWARVEPAVLAPLHAGGPPAARLAGFVAGYLERLRTDPAFRALAVVTTTVAPRSDAAAGLDGKRDGLDGWRAEIRAVLAAAGPLAGGLDVGHGVFLVMNLLVGATLTVVTHPAAMPAGDATGTVAAAAVAGLFPPEPTP
ncbi:hypothetical protein BJF78_03075 [Pseudonocardia sp. CNS-139]|nr:hypothetical protein BJF78_03075 [Pseudonocardia sp. CNS-139]